MSEELTLKWRSPGPVASAFMACNDPVQGIQGPIGSGKTSTCLVKMIRICQRQQPSRSDGVRRIKVCCVRDTYRKLWDTLIPSWWEWVPKSVGTWVGGEDQPAQHVIPFKQGGERLELIVDFVAIGDNRVEDILRGYQPTMFYLNEADLLSIEVLYYCRGRAGRFPRRAEGGPSWYGVLMDFNAPDTDSELYKLLIEDRPEGFAYFRQPSGLSPDAENLENLPPGYYENQMAGQPDWYIDRMIKNKFGYSRDGKPVYPEYNDDIHAASKPLLPMRGIPLKIGLDAGGTPAAALTQQMPNGQWRILHELVVPNTTVMGPNRFGENLNQDLNELFSGLRAFGFADPSAAYGADVDNDELNWIQIVEKVTGIPIRPAETNAPTVRQDAVRKPLTRMIDGHHPGLLVSPTCKVLRRGFNSTYRYRRKQIAGTGRYDDKPEKNDASHPHDALQYALLGGGEYADVMHRQQNASRLRSQAFAIDEDNPYGGFGDDEGYGPRRRGGYQRFAIEE